MKSVTNTWQNKVYKLVKSTDNSEIKRDVSPVVYDKNMSPFQVSVFAYLFRALERLVRNKLLVGGFPKYVLYGCKVKTEYQEVCVVEFSLGLNPNYMKSTSKILLNADKLMTQEIQVKVPKDFNIVEVKHGDVIDVFSKLNNEKQYQEMANDILSCFIVDSMKKEKVTK